MVSTTMTPTTSVVDRAYSGFDSALPAVPNTLVPSGKLLTSLHVIETIGENRLPRETAQAVALEMRSAGGFIGHNLLKDYTGALISAMARSDHPYAPLAGVVEHQLNLAGQFEYNTMPPLSPLLTSLASDKVVETRVLGVPSADSLVPSSNVIVLPNPLAEYMAA